MKTTEEKRVRTRQHSHHKHQRVDTGLFMGIGAEGVTYSDRSREVGGDFARVGFYAFDDGSLKLPPDADSKLAQKAAQDVMRMCRDARRLKISVRELCREFAPVYCCECRAYIDHVRNETYGVTGTFTTCEKCHQEYLQELSENGVKV